MIKFLIENRAALYTVRIHSLSIGAEESAGHHLGPVHKLHGQDCAQIWVRFGCGDQRKTAGVAALR
jgi:hypothetical protein